VWAFVRHRAGDPVLVVVNNGDAGSGTLQLPLRGHFREGQELVTVPLEFDSKSGRLMESAKDYQVKGGGIKLDMKARSAVILTSKR
jgi:hypothetical protein